MVREGTIDKRVEGLRTIFKEDTQPILHVAKERAVGVGHLHVERVRNVGRLVGHLRQLQEDGVHVVDADSHHGRGGAGGKQPASKLNLGPGYKRRQPLAGVRHQLALGLPVDLPGTDVLSDGPAARRMRLLRTGLEMPHPHP